MFQPSYVTALREISKLQYLLKGALFNYNDMEQETKTVTIPLSEFEEMRSKAAQYQSIKGENHLQQNPIIDELAEANRKCHELEEKLKLYTLYEAERSDLIIRTQGLSEDNSYLRQCIKELEKENNMLKDKLEKIQIT